MCFTWKSVGLYTVCFLIKCIAIRVPCSDPVLQNKGLRTGSLSYPFICLLIKSEEIKQKQSTVCLQSKFHQVTGFISRVYQINESFMKRGISGNWGIFYLLNGERIDWTCWACVDKYLQSLSILCFKYPAHGVLKPA